MEGRRARIAVVALAVLAVTSGCGFISGEQPLTFASSDLRVDPDARTETGYELARADATNRSRTFSAAGVERRVEVTNHLREYRRNVSVLGRQGSIARFTALSTPKVEFAGQGPLNPVGDLSNRELVDRLQSSYETMEDVEFVENRTVEALGDRRTVSTFSATARTVGGVEVDVYVHVAKFTHGEDFVVAVAIHPRAVDEEERIDALLRNLVHPYERSA